MAWRYLDLADFLLIAEAVLQIAAEDLARAGRLELAESALHAPGAEFGGVEFYPDLACKTAVLASRLIGNHPLPDGNKRVGYMCAIDFVECNGGTWTHPRDDPRVTKPSPSSKVSLPAASARTSSPRGSPNGSSELGRPLGRRVDDGPHRLQDSGP